MPGKIRKAIRKNKLIAIAAGLAGAGAIALGAGLSVGLSATSAASENEISYNLRATPERFVTTPIPQEEGYGPWVVQDVPELVNRGDVSPEWAALVGFGVTESELQSAPVGAVLRFNATATAIGNSSTTITRTFVITLTRA